MWVSLIQIPTWVKGLSVKGALDRVCIISQSLHIIHHAIQKLAEVKLDDYLMRSLYKL